MAVATIAHKPQLTKEQAQEIFARHFAGKYKVEDFKGPFRDFQIVRNAFIGVSVKLQQTGAETKFVFVGFTPKLWARMLTGVFLILASWLFWNGMMNEVKELIESAPEFK